MRIVMVPGPVELICGLGGFSGIPISVHASMETGAPYPLDVAAKT